MAVLSREQVAQILYQAGVHDDNTLAQFVAIAGRESGYKTDAIRTNNPGGNTGDWGLFQINYTNLSALRAIGITSMQQLLDPVTNARAAVYLYQKAGGFSPWGMGSNGWQAGGNPFKNTNLAAAGQAVVNARNAGMLGQPYTGGGSTAIPGAQPGAPMTSGPIKLPSDTQLVNVGYNIYAVYDVGGVKLAYTINTAPNAVDWKSHGALTTFTQDQFNQQGYIMAGDATELGTVTETFGNYRSFYNSILSRVMGPYNPAKDDPEVQRVLADFAARPDMDPAELQNKLQATKWYQTHTQGELEWNGLSAAEQQKRRDQVVQQATDTWFQVAGERVDPGDPRVANYIEQLASGKMGWGAFTQIVQKAARDNPESPFMRDTRAEQEAQRQRGVDIENTMQNIRDTLRKWGLAWTDGNIRDWAQQIVEKRSSDEDLMQSIKQQAAHLYPWKDPEMETLQAAQPWLRVYEKRFDGKQGSLTDPLIQGALLKGTLPFEFDKQIKRSSQWLTTQNARDELMGAGFEVAKRMGFQMS